MIYTPLTKKAINLIYEKHNGQFDKAGLPYVFHPMHVAETMDDEISTLAALLHDIVEDTDMTFNDLLNYGFPLEVIEVLKLLTHEENVDYYDYIKKISTNPVAVKVKIADLKHNSDLTRLDKITDYDIKRTEKYKNCIEFLSNYLVTSESEKNNIK